MITDIKISSIRGPEIRRDEIFKEGDRWMEKLFEVFNTFANSKLTELNSGNNRIVGLRLKWTSWLEEDAAISRIDLALAWTDRHQPKGDPALAKYETEIEEELKKELNRG